MESRVRKRFRNLLLETVVAISVLTTILVYGSYVPHSSSAHSFKWFAFAANTAIIFGYALSILRPLWYRPKFWTVFTGLLVLHGIVGVLALTRVDYIPLVWYVPIIPAEILVICHLVEKAFYKTWRRSMLGL